MSNFNEKKRKNDRREFFQNACPTETSPTFFWKSGLDAAKQQVLKPDESETKCLLSEYMCSFVDANATGITKAAKEHYATDPRYFDNLYK